MLLTSPCYSVTQFWETCPRRSRQYRGKAISDITIWLTLNVYQHVYQEAKKKEAAGKMTELACKLLILWSHSPNRRPADYESAALPTELGWLSFNDNGSWEPVQLAYRKDIHTTRDVAVTGPSA